MQKVVGLIPARLKSSRFPEKVLADIRGKSLIQRTYERACRCELLDELFIAADDERILSHVESFGAKGFLTSRAHPSGSDRIAEVASNLLDTEIIINIQADQPLLNPLVVDAIVEALREDSDRLCCTPVVLSHDREEFASTSVVKCVFNKEGKALYFSRAQIPFVQKKGQPFSFYKHLGIYGFRRDFLLTYVQLAQTPLGQAEDLEQLKILEHGYPLHVVVVEDASIGVDTPEDLQRVEPLCESISL